MYEGPQPPACLIIVNMLRRLLRLLEPLLQTSYIPYAEANLERLRLDGQARRIGVTLMWAREDWSLRGIGRRQDFKGAQDASERDVHFSVRQMRPGTHARACSKCKMLRPHPLRDI